MRSLANLRNEFDRVAHAALDERFQVKPSLRIEEQTFQEILEPIFQVFEDDPVYTQNRNLDVPNMLDEMRRMCLEAHTKSTRRGCAREDRTNLVNTLQSIKDKADEGVDANGMRAADMDFFSLPDLIPSIREAVDIHYESLDRDEIAKALSDVANNIESAQKRLWRPEFPSPELTSGVVAADNYDYE